MSEALLFFIVGGIAVAAAIMMLISRNAVHSALFLVVNFGCVAFLYLMLDAPFLAMIQIAVYAGAIMVLFLFVIMLLGTDDVEKTRSQIPGYRYLALLGVVLGVAFLLIAGIGITSGQISFSDITPPEPLLRVVHAAPYAGEVDVYVDGQPFAQGVLFAGASDFQTVTSGKHEIVLAKAGTTEAVATAEVELEGSTSRSENTFTAIAYGGDAQTPPQIVLTPTDLESIEARKSRLIIFNGYDKSLNLVDYGSPFDETETDPTKRDDRVIYNDILPGTLVELPLLPENQSLQSWGFGEANAARPLVRLNNPAVYSIKRDISQLLIVTSEQTSDGSVRQTALALVNEAAPSFGSPSAIGSLLFARFILPFQLIAVLLLAAMVGAIVLTHKESFVARRRDVRRRVVRPLGDVISGQVGQDVTGQEEYPQLPENQPEAAGD